VREFAFDTETLPIRPGRQAPRIVCVQSVEGGLELRDAGLDRIERALRDPSVLLYGHNTAYDVLCSIATRPSLAPLWLAAYRADRVTCTFLRERLIRIALGEPCQDGLQAVLERYGIADPYAEGAKDSTVRTGYGALDGVPVSDWPQESIDYALADLSVAQVFRAQESHARYLQDQFRRARGALWLEATSAWGMRVDAGAVRVLGEMAEAEFDQMREMLIYADSERVRAYAESRDLEAPIVPCTPLVRPTGSKDTTAAKNRMVAVSGHLGLPIPRTKMLGVALDVDSCLASLDPMLIAYARFGSISTVRGRVRRLELAAHLGLPIQPRFDALVATGRTSASGGGRVKPGKAYSRLGDQTQNLPREPGLRECYVARPGHLILSCDWKSAELHGLAQACLDMGFDSQLARLLNEGVDTLLWFACYLRGWQYPWASSPDRTPDEKKQIKNARQSAKAYMYALPGGLGLDKFRQLAAKQYGIRLTAAQAAEGKEAWLSAFPEMRRYFDHVNRLIQSGEPLRHFMSDRFRGNLRYTSAANSYFQGRVGDMLMDAGWQILEKQWTGTPMRSWNQAHDEILVEYPEHETSIPSIVVGIMDSVGAKWCPGCPAKAEPALQRHWRKGAEPVYRDGLLIPWEDRNFVQDPKVLALDRDPVYKSWLLGIEPSQVER